jgi:broad specificity phosphatase PhoE
VPPAAVPGVDDGNGDGGYFLFIRHGNDKVRRPPRIHDHDITEEGKTAVREKARELYATYGLPDVVVVSPLQRTRTTAAVLVDELRLLSDQKALPKLDVEPRFGRRFTEKEQRAVDIHTDTRNFRPPIYEDDAKFKQRVDNGLVDVTRSYAGQRVWVITHFVVIRRSSDHLDFPMHSGGKMPFLWVSQPVAGARMVKQFRRR